MTNMIDKYNNFCFLAALDAQPGCEVTAQQTLHHIVPGMCMYSFDEAENA